MSDLQVNGGHANIESLHEDSFLVQAMNLQRELGSPRILNNQQPVLINHALPQKQRSGNKQSNQSRRRQGSNNVGNVGGGEISGAKDSSGPFSKAASGA